MAAIPSQCRALRSLAYLITCGSLLGYTGFIYLIEHVPVAKVASYTYVNPVVAVLLGIFLLHERPASENSRAWLPILLAVFLLPPRHGHAGPASRPCWTQRLARQQSRLYLSKDTDTAEAIAQRRKYNAQVPVERGCVSAA